MLNAVLMHDLFNLIGIEVYDQEMAKEENNVPYDTVLTPELVDGVY